MPYNRFKLTRTTPSQLRGIQESYYYESDNETLSEILATGYFTGFPCDDDCETVVTVNASDGWANVHPNGDGGASETVNALIGDKTAQEVSDNTEVVALDSRKPRKLFASVFSTEKVLTIASVGDSLALSKFNHLVPMLDRYAGGISRTGVITDSSVKRNQTAGNDLFSLSGGVLVSGQFEYWITGQLIQASNETVTFGSGGVDPTFKTISIFYIIEPGGGSFDVDIDSVTVQTIDTSNTEIDAGVFSYDAGSRGQRSVEIASIGTVKIIGINVTTGDSGVNWFSLFFNLGGTLLSNSMLSESAQRSLTSVLNNIDLDLITFEMDDEFGTGVSDQQSFLNFSQILDNTQNRADKLIIASTPRLSNEEGKKFSRDWLRAECSKRDRSYLFFDSYGLLGTYQGMIDIFGSDDGVHPSVSAQAYSATIIWDYLGLNTSYAGPSPSSLNALGEPSSIAKDSLFVGPGGNSLGLYTDDSFGFDWDITAPRAVSITNSLFGKTLARFGSNGISNLFSLNFTELNNSNLSFETSGSGASFEVRINDSGKSDDDGSGMLVCLVKPPFINRATVISSYPANQHQGCRIRVPDGSDGDAIYVSTGIVWVNEATGNSL